MNISINKISGTQVVAIEGRLDTTNYSELEGRLAELIENNEYNILLDMQDLEYISSSGLRILLLYLKKIKAVEGSFGLCAMNPEIREIFEISGFVNIFEIFENRDAALNN